MWAFDLLSFTSLKQNHLSLVDNKVLFRRCKKWLLSLFSDYKTTPARFTSCSCLHSWYLASKRSYFAFSDFVIPYCLSRLWEKYAFRYFCTNGRADAISEEFLSKFKVFANQIETSELTYYNKLADWRKFNDWFLKCWCTSLSSKLKSTFFAKTLRPSNVSLINITKAR